MWRSTLSVFAAETLSVSNGQRTIVVSSAVLVAKVLVCGCRCCFFVGNSLFSLSVAVLEVVVVVVVVLFIIVVFVLLRVYFKEESGGCFMMIPCPALLCTW